MIYGIMIELFQDSDLRKIKIIRYLDKFILKKA